MINWIKKLVEDARKKNWCTKTYCTTCGASFFRTALVLRSKNVGNINLRLKKISKQEKIYYTGNNETPPSKPKLCDLPYKKDFRA